MSILLLLLGFVILIKGADFLVDSSSKIAKLFHMPSFLIGVTIVAFGTSAPEAVVGIISSFKDANDIILGAVVGSNIANIALIISVLALLNPIPISKEIARKEIFFSVLVQALLFILLILSSGLSRLDGILLLVIFALFFSFVILNTKKVVPTTLEGDITNPSTAKNERSFKAILKLLILFLLGLTGLILGGDMVVKNSQTIASSLGISDMIIGLTVVAIGTSLPELASSIVAYRKKEDGIAVGNIVGSNVFNSLFVLGISSSISPIHFSTENMMDLIAMLVISLVFLALGFFRHQVGRFAGSLFLLGYIVFMALKFL